MKFDAEQFKEQRKNMEETFFDRRETLFDKYKSSRSIHGDVKKICSLCTSKKLIHKKLIHKDNILSNIMFNNSFNILTSCLPIATKPSYKRPSYDPDYTLFEFFDEFLFGNWKFKNEYNIYNSWELWGTIDESLEYSSNLPSDLEKYIDKKINEKNEEKLILILEYFQNMMYLFDKFYVDKFYETQKYGDEYCSFYLCDDSHGGFIYNNLKERFKNLLDDLNLEVHTFDDKEEVIITGKSTTVTAVLPLVEEKFRRPIIEYNAKRLKGDLEKKKIILRELGEKLEGRRKDFQNKHKEFNNKFKNKLDELLSDETLEKNQNKPENELISLINAYEMGLYNLLDDIFCMLNNLDIRHPNTDKKDNEHNFKQKTLELKESGKLEEYYDDLYQMILLANLEIEQIENRNEKIQKLRNGLKN